MGTDETTPLQELLIARGYRKWVSRTTKILKMTDTLYQKRIDDEIGKKYFINVYYYPERRYGIHDVDEGIQIEVQFYDNQDEGAMDVTFFEKDIDKAEEKIENVWHTLNLGYYERWEDA